MRITKFSVHRDVIGSLQHAFYENGKITWIDDIPDTEWVINPSDGLSSLCMKTLLKVNGVEIEFIPGSVQQKVYRKLVPTVNVVPWSLCLPPKAYKESVKKFLIAASTLDLDLTYYNDVYKPFNKLIRKLKPFQVDIKKIRKLFDSANDSLSTHLESCLPGSDGLTYPPTYDFFGTRTGRLTVSSGPMVLTLPKEQRNIFLPSKNSRIVQIDFSSLEPRLLSALAKLPPIEGDLYEDISKICFSKKLTREKMKISILGILYGMSAETLSGHIALSVDECKNILSIVKRHFKIKELLTKIERDTFGKHTKNFFGRLIELNKASVLNNFVQSSSIDIVHMGFEKFLSDSEFMSIGFRPMFLIHDALVGEISEDKFNNLKELADKGFYCSHLKFVFPLTISDFAK